jgi:hypothetical protein
VTTGRTQDGSSSWVLALTDLELTKALHDTAVRVRKEEYDRLDRVERKALSLTIMASIVVTLTTAVYANSAGGLKATLPLAIAVFMGSGAGVASTLALLVRTTRYGLDASTIFPSWVNSSKEELPFPTSSYLAYQAEAAAEAAKIMEECATRKAKLLRWAQVLQILFFAAVLVQTGVTVFR